MSLLNLCASHMYSAGFGVVAGITTFLVLSRRPCRGDIFLTGASAGFALVFMSCMLVGQSAVQALYTTGLVLLSYTGAGISSVIFYNLSPWHPLASYPGPLLDRMTSLKASYVAATGRQHEYHVQIHARYGDVVRVRPNALSFNTSKAVWDIHSPKPFFAKSDAYTPHFSGESIFFSSSKEIHSYRRRVWLRAFTPDAIRTYVSKLDGATNELASSILARGATGQVDMGECIASWAYDAMGGMLFGSSSTFSLLKNGDTVQIAEKAKLAQFQWHILGKLPWLMDILEHIPGLDPFRDLMGVVEEHLNRKRSEKRETDIASYLLEEENTGISTNDILAEVLIGAVAGADTTSGVLTYMLFLVTDHPDVYTRLYADLAEAYPDKNAIIESEILNSLPYLNAVINEGLRLGSPFPGFPRVAPADGAVIDGHVVPGGTSVSTPNYAQTISEQNVWPKPLEFKPERWLPGGLGPDARLDRACLNAFSFGPYACVGRQIALEEIRFVMARLMLSVRFSFPDDFDPKKFRQGVQNAVSTVFTYPLRMKVQAT